MPWRERSPMDERLQLVQEHATGLFSVTELATQYGVSRKTAYLWIARFRTEGISGLHERSSRPHTSPTATDDAIVDAIVAERRRHPSWGAAKLLAVLARAAPTVEWPKRTTVCDLLRKRDLIRPRRRVRRERRTSTPCGTVTATNATWTTDFKGEFRTGDGAYCYPLTLRDAFSRFVLRCDALAAPGYAVTRQCFERAFIDYGLPERIRSDNGTPFASPGLGGLSRLSVWWMRLGIIPERIMKGHPEQNGSHEQFHRVLQGTTRPPAPNRAAQQQRFRRFCWEYNEERPHAALHQQPPAAVYTPSPRPYPRRVPALAYPAHLETRRVGSNGEIKWKGGKVFLSRVLADQDVGLEAVDDGVWTIYFAATVLARFDERSGRVRSLR